MKYLVLGANGMAGHVIAQYLVEQGCDVVGFAREKSPVCTTIIGDALIMSDIEKAIKSQEFDVVINAIGILNKSVDENLNIGRYINSELPHELVNMLNESKTKLIHISTDCVFEGTKGKYTEDDTCDATSLYGQTKAAGEVNDDKNLTIRTSIVGPELKKNGIGLFHWFMSQKGSVSGYKRVIWSGVTTLELAKAIYQDSLNPKTGLMHLCNNESICKYELLILFNQYCRNDKVEIAENASVVNDKSIVSTRKDIINIVPSYEKMIIEMADWIKKHSELYGQYIH